MPAVWATVAKLGFVLAILLTGIAFLRWILKRAEEKKQAEDQLRETEEKLAQSEAARAKEGKIADATRKVREEPGPIVPDIKGGEKPR